MLKLCKLGSADLGTHRLYMLTLNTKKQVTFNVAPFEHPYVTHFFSPENQFYYRNFVLFYYHLVYRNDFKKIYTDVDTSSANSMLYDKKWF